MHRVKRYLQRRLPTTTTNTVSFIRNIFTKKGGNLGTNGSLAFLFDRKGVFTIPVANVKSMDDFEMEVLLREEEIEVNDETIWGTVAMEDFGRMQKVLESLGIDVENAELRRIPNDLKQVDVSTAMKTLRLIEDFWRERRCASGVSQHGFTEDIMAAMEADD